MVIPDALLDELCQELGKEFKDDVFVSFKMSWCHHGGILFRTITCKYRNRDVCHIEITLDYIKLTVASHVYYALIDHNNVWTASSLNIRNNQGIYIYELELPNCFDLLYSEIRELIKSMKAIFDVG